MKRLIALLAALSLTAHAAEVVPPYLAGIWATGASLFDGDTGQSEMYLRSDGYGMMAGSTPPARRADGVDDGKPAPRAVIGFPLRAAMDGDRLMLRPFLPKGMPGMAREIVIPCRYEQTERTLICTMPEKPKTLELRRREETIPADVEKMLNQIVQMEQQ